MQLNWCFECYTWIMLLLPVELHNELWCSGGCCFERWIILLSAWWYFRSTCLFWSVSAKREHTRSFWKLESIVGLVLSAPTSHFSFMTSNATESLNAHLLWALLEAYRVVVEKWFDEWRAGAGFRDHTLTKVTIKKLSKSVKYEQQLTIPHF